MCWINFIQKIGFKYEDPPKILIRLLTITMMHCVCVCVQGHCVPMYFIFHVASDEIKSSIYSRYRQEVPTHEYSILILCNNHRAWIQIFNEVQNCWHSLIELFFKITLYRLFHIEFLSNYKFLPFIEHFRLTCLIG